MQSNSYRVVHEDSVTSVLPRDVRPALSPSFARELVLLAPVQPIGKSGHCSMSSSTAFPAFTQAVPPFAYAITLE